jgi:hypothetical protein
MPSFIPIPKPSQDFHLHNRFGRRVGRQAHKEKVAQAIIVTVARYVFMAHQYKLMGSASHTRTRNCLYAGRSKPFGLCSISYL